MLKLTDKDLIQIISIDLEDTYVCLDTLVKYGSPKLKEAAKLCKSILEDATK